MSRKLPNFLIVGMAKCGTSSLANYFSQHPDIFISERKEPRFFTSQDKEIYPINGPKDHAVMDWYVPDYEDYCKLFENTQAKMIGEASADTLYFDKYTIPLIKKHLVDPKIVIIIRNPVKRAFSAYQHLRRDKREHISFEEGIEFEEERVANNWELIYHYKKVGLYYEHIKAFMENFTDVKVLTNETLSANPNEVLKESFSFLEVDDTFEVDTSLRLNPSGIPKSRFLHDLIWKESLLKKILRPFVRIIYRSKTARKQISNKIMSQNLDRLKIEDNTAQELKKYFHDDVMKTSELIGQDLSAWVK